MSHPIVLITPRILLLFELPPLTCWYCSVARTALFKLELQIFHCAICQFYWDWYTGRSGGIDTGKGVEMEINVETAGNRMGVRKRECKV